MKSVAMRMRLMAVTMRYEWRQLRREAVTWFVAASLIAATAFALAVGSRLVAAQSATAAAAKVEEARRIADLKKTLIGLRTAPPKEPLRPYGDPRNAVFVGGGSGAAVAAPEPAALAFVAAGLSDLYPPAMKVTSGSKDGFLFANELENPAHLLSGAIDYAFVLIFVFPLSILALTYNLIAGEREQGTLAMTLADSQDPAATLFGKLALRWGWPTLVAAGALVAGVWRLGGRDALLSEAFAALLLILVVYGAFWALLAAAFDSRGGSSAKNALALASAWVLLSLILPAASNSFGNYLYPAPSRAQMALAARAGVVDADREMDAALAQYQEEHADDAELKRGDAKERTARRLATQEAAFERVENVIARHQAQIDLQRVLTDRVAFASPTILAYTAVARLAGVDQNAYREFYARLDRFHRQWRAFFLERAHAGRSLELEDYDAFPRFGFFRLGPAAPLASVADLLLGILAPTFLLGVIAWRGFSRCRP